ncbi:MAG: hypothetical protein ABIN80_19935 [Dyadobacter sp.]|uniref:hypothetical protein n=1 Tax=Dyadobacter sp. TaxID=1914288 RepID=UPI0032647AF8
MPQDAIVVTEGYEDGFDIIRKVSLMKVEENPEKRWWVGKYIDSEKAEAVEVVFLNAETKAEKI